jgi:WD repeat and SOF domain-containing protein 1
LNKRETESRNYNNKLIEKFQYNPEIRRIKRHKQVPKYILNKKKELQIQKESKFRKQRNKEMNTKLGSLDYETEKKAKVVKSDIIKK